MQTKKIFYISFIFTILLLTIDNQLFAQTNTVDSTFNQLDKLQQKKIKKFWNWVIKNENQLSKPFTYPETQIDMINKLSEINPELQYTMDVEKSIYKLTITCGTNKNLIPLVNSIVVNAPKLSFCEVVAFKQRENIPDSLFFDSAILFAKDLKIYITNDHYKLHFQIFVNNYSKKDYRIDKMVMDYLKLSLGEYSLMTDVGSINIEFSENFRVYMQTTSITNLYEKVQEEKKMFYR